MSRFVMGPSAGCSLHRLRRPADRRSAGGLRRRQAPVGRRTPDAGVVPPCAGRRAHRRRLRRGSVPPSACSLMTEECLTVISKQRTVEGSPDDRGSRKTPDVKPAPFEYAAPTTVADAVAALAEHG